MQANLADPFQQVRVLGLFAMALLLLPSVMPPLRPHARRVRLAAIVLYGGGGLAILARWWFGGA